MVNVNKEDLIEEIIKRGVAHIYPSEEALRDRLFRGEKLTLYLGIDPTGPTLHLGHVIPLLKLSAFQKLGHKIILLIGNFTARIGDPDKLSVRVPLTEKEIKENVKSYKKQAELFLDFSGKNKAEIRYNSEWLGRMNFGEVLSLASNVSVGQILERDMFQKRIAEGRPIYLHEFLYPLMQGYDSVAMEVDGEIGGSDQVFNMLVGRHMEKQMIGKDKFVLATKLLEDPTGAKMGKTTGNMVSLDQSPAEIFGRVMSWKDEMILLGFELATRMELEDIEQIREEIESGANPKDVKMRLAGEIVGLVYDKKDSDSARESFVATFSKRELPQEMKEVCGEKDELLSAVLIREKIVKSKSEFRRLVEEGAVSVFAGDSEVKISEPEFLLDRDVRVKIGKRRFLSVRTSS